MSWFLALLCCIFMRTFQVIKRWKICLYGIDVTSMIFGIFLILICFCSGEEWSQECWEEPREKCSSVPRQVWFWLDLNRKVNWLKDFDSILVWLKVIVVINTYYGRGFLSGACDLLKVTRLKKMAKIHFSAIL